MDFQFEWYYDKIIEELFESSVKEDDCLFDFESFETGIIDKKPIGADEQWKLLISDSDFDDIFNTFEIKDTKKIDISSSTENKMNLRREDIMRETITPKFLNYIYEEDFEFGYICQSELLLREQFEINTLATRNWLNGIFIKNYNNSRILNGILRVLGRFEESIIFPQGNTMATAVLSHKDPEIVELGIRAFEEWGSIESLNVLKTVNVEPEWLKQYLNQVISDLEEELCPC